MTDKNRVPVDVSECAREAVAIATLMKQQEPFLESEVIASAIDDIRESISARVKNMGNEDVTAAIIYTAIQCLKP